MAKQTYEKEIEMIDQGLIPFGRHMGMKINEIDDSYIHWFETKSNYTHPNAELSAKIHTRMKSEYEERGLDEKFRAEAEKSKHVGKIKERRIMDLRCDHILSFQSAYGTTFLNKCRDRQGNLVIYKGANRWQKHMCYRVKATITEHNTYGDYNEKQTFVTRPTIIQLLGESPNAKKET